MKTQPTQKLTPTEMSMSWQASMGAGFVHLDYRGKGCGGCNLPFKTVEDAIEYASWMYATEAKIESIVDGQLVTRTFTREDCRFKFTEVTAS